MNLYQWLCLIGVQGAVVTILTIVITKTVNKVEKNAEKIYIINTDDKDLKYPNSEGL